MPWNGSGTYLTPAGQPVVTGTVISSTTFNNLVTDLSSAFNNTLPRDGQAPMAAQFKAVSGTVTLPGISFNSEQSTGLYWAGTGLMGFTSQGVEYMRSVSGRLLIGTTSDDGVSRLQVNGPLKVSGNSTVTGNTSITGTESVTGNITSGGTITATTSLYTSGTVTATGAITSSSSITATGNLVTNATAYIAPASGSAILNLTRASQSTGQTTLNLNGGTGSTTWQIFQGAGTNDLGFYSSGTASTVVTLNAATNLVSLSAALSVGTNASVGGTLGVTGATTLSSTLNVTGATTLGTSLSVVANASVGGTLGVTGASTLSGTLGVAGATSLNNTLYVSSTLTSNGPLNALGVATVGSTLGVTGALTVGGAITGSSSITATGSLITNASAYVAPASGSAALNIVRASQAAGQTSVTLNGGSGSSTWQIFQQSGSNDLGFYSSALGSNAMTMFASTGAIAIPSTNPNALQVGGFTATNTYGSISCREQIQFGNGGSFACSIGREFGSNSNLIFIGGTTSAFRIVNYNNTVQLGSMDNGGNLTVGGTSTATGFTVASSAAIKDVYGDLDGETAFQRVMRWLPKVYSLKAEDKKRLRSGLIVEEAPREITDGEGHIDMYAMITELGAAVQFLAKKVLK